MNFSIVVATDNQNGIGIHSEINNSYYIPWNNKHDMLFFKNLTSSNEKNNAVIIGKNTYNSLPKKLPLRKNIIISNSLKTTDDELIIINSLDEALNYCNENQFDNVFVIGGRKLYKEALENKYLNKIYWNIINSTAHNKCNIDFPITFNEAKKKYNLEFTEYDSNKRIEFNLFSNKNLDEINYLSLLNKIMINGYERQTRNSLTKSLFGEKLEFDLNDKFPILTTKKMFIRGIFEELIWFLNGQTNSKILENKGINIWKQNTNKEFLSQNKLSYIEGDCGPMYGYQLLHCGFEYNGCDNNYENKGFNQLEYCLDLLRHDKYSRRIIMTTFIPQDANKGVLYPCHGITIQFYVKEIENINYLSCHMYQRSGDMFLGVPFNITSYSFLVYMICEVLNNEGINYKPDKLIISFGDIHIYNSHFDQVKLQLKRNPFKFPKLYFKNKKYKINEFKWDDIEIKNYNYFNKIKAEMIA